MFTFKDWINVYKKSQDSIMKLHTPGREEGYCHHHTGATIIFAHVDIELRPSDILEYEWKISEEHMRFISNQNYDRAISCGVMDIMLSGTTTSIFNYKCIVHLIETRKKGDNHRALRLAARDATQRILFNYNYNMLWSFETSDKERELDIPHNNLYSTNSPLM